MSRVSSVWSRLVPTLTITVTMEDDDGYPDVDRKSCELLGETALVRIPSCTSQYSKFIAQIVQALMGVLVICSLAYKRQRESPKRPWKIW